MERTEKADAEESIFLKYPVEIERHSSVRRERALA
jgi:hypothetical protein